MMSRLWSSLPFLVSLYLAKASLAYDTDTHQSLGEIAAQRSATDVILRQELGFPGGADTVLRQGALALSPSQWVGEGAREEDLPHSRVLNHFHNPLLPWRDAGLTLLLQEIGDSSALWGQRPRQSPGGTWTWARARSAFLNALTAPTADEREQRLATTFETLGHLTHLVQDATVPAHVRNDPHPSIPFVAGTLIPLNPDFYEDWVEETRTGRTELFSELLALPPTRPLRLVLHSIDPEAPIGIAGLIDTDRVTADGPRPSILGPADVGVAELTNPNFLSRDTIFTRFPRPGLADLGPGFFEEEQGAFRRYFPKVVPGTSAVEIPHFVAEGVLRRHLLPFSAQAPPAVLWHLDERVHEAYARELIPRAIGYSAGLIDYFFRGRLDVDLGLDPLNPGLVHLTGVNASPEPLFEGTLTLYADTVTGQRVHAPAIDPATVLGVGAGEPLTPVRFEPPADAERFVAVYQGTLGLERVSEGFPGAVIGKVLGGVRVEEIFADGDRWRLRTPTGVFDLPLATETFEEVKWGDEDDVLVARTPPLAADPGLVATYEILRRPGSIEPVLSGTPPTVELRARRAASLAFATAPLVTTIAFAQTTQHSQQIGRWREILATQWTEPVNSYQTVSITRDPVVFETVHQETVSFAATIPIRLDPEHNLDLGTEAEPYYWELVDVGADRDGRIVGLAAVSLTAPPVAPASVPFFRLDSDGRAFPSEPLTLRAHFPANLTVIWALVDLAEGTIVAATAEPTVTISARHASEAPPWEGGGAGHSFFPGIYRHAVTTYAGGPLAGRVDEHVDAPSISPRLATGGPRLDVTAFEQALSVSGWFQPEIRSALERSGLASFEVGEVRRDVLAWNYACLVDPCLTDGEKLGFEIVLRRGGVLAPPAELVSARRARPAPPGERLVLLADAVRTTSRPVGSVVAWDVGARTAREALHVPDSFHGLGPEASTDAVLLSYRPAVGTRGTFFVPLVEGAVASFFPELDLRVDFTVLAPDRLYGVRDFRFYRTAPPLQATPLPARLSPLSSGPPGDYHAIRVP